MKFAHAIFPVVALSLFAFATPASADMMNFTGPELTQWVKFHCDGKLADGMTVRAGSYGVLLDGREFDAYCVDADQYAGSCEVSVLDIDVLPNHEQIAYLYETFSGSAVNSTRAAALGVALWELLYESEGNAADVTAGEFYITRNCDVADLANSMLTDLPEQYSPVMDLSVLHSPCKQDMLIGGLAAVPEPTTMALLFIGAALTIVRRRRAC